MTRTNNMMYSISTLQIDDAEPDDSGEYQCIAGYKACLASAMNTTNLLVLPRKYYTFSLYVHVCSWGQTPPDQCFPHFSLFLVATCMFNKYCYAYFMASQ